MFKLSNNKITFVFFLIIIIFLLPRPARAASQDNLFGVNVGLELRFEQSEESTVMEKLGDLNIKWVREEFNWNVIEPSKGIYDWNGYDRIMEKYNNAGINVLGVIAYSAGWASTAPDDISATRDKYPPNSADWENYVATLVARYPEILYWEVWNEPNHPNFLIADDQAATYKDMLQTASTAIRTANPQAKVVIGGLSGSDSNFMRQLYLNGAAEYFDIVAIHPYRAAGGLNIYPPEMARFGLGSLTSDLYVMRSVIHDYTPDNPAPIWITEIGWSTYAGGLNETEQGDYLQRSFLLSRMYPQIEKIFWYNLRDETSADSQDQNYGLYDYNWQAKASVSALKQLATYYPTLVMQEDHEAFSKPVEEFQDASRIKVEEYDNGSKVKEAGVRDFRSVKALRGLGSVLYHYKFINNEVGQYLKFIIESVGWYSAETYDMWLWSDGGTHSVRFRIKDSQGETFQGNAGYTGFGWTRLNISLKDTSYNFVSWGGDNDGVVDFPITIDSIIIEKNTQSPIFEGDVILSRLTYRRYDQAYSVKFQQDNRNVWAFWKMDGSPQVASIYAPITTRIMNMWNLRDTGYRNIAPFEAQNRKVIVFGLEEQPLFIQ